VPIKVGSLCSGIGVPEHVFSGDGYKLLFCAEINKFSSAVLAHRYPHVPNLGDIEKIDGSEWEGKIDILIGGPPCQAFSIMGKGESLKDPRGMLTLEYVRLLKETNPAIAIYENVPNILSAKCNPWGTFLAAITGDANALLPNGEPIGDDGSVKWPNSGLVAGGGKSIAWTIMDAQNFGVPQRRKRVWAVIANTRKLAKLVGAPSNFDTGRLWTIPSEILFDESSQRRSPPTRKRENPATAGRSFAIGFSANDRGGDAGIELCPTIRSGSHLTTWANSTGGGAAVAISDGCGGWTIRYLTTYECEVAFGLPGNHTQIPWNGQPTAPDGNRKTAIGNTMAVPCLNHIKLRLETVIASYKNFFKEQENLMTQDRPILVSPELKDFIPPLQPEEFQLLKASILKEGCLQPILVWEEENMIVDGHNRYNICQENNIDFQVIYRSFADETEVKIWMGVHQLARRNFTPHSTFLMKGKIVALVERRRPGERRDEKGMTNSELRALLNVKSDHTLRQAEQYYRAIDQIAEVRPEISNDIELGKIALNREEVVAIGSLVALDKELATELMKAPKLPDNRRLTPEFKEGCRQVREFVNNTYPTIEEQKAIAPTPEEWLNFKCASNAYLKFDDEAWVEVGNEIRRQQVQQNFSSKREELEARGRELGLNKNFANVLAKSWLQRQQSEAPQPDKKLEYEMLPTDLTSYSDAAISAAIARLQKEQEKRKNVKTQLNIAA
jgi:DNA (cytosine-5)-methyltransferase 1